MVIPKIAYSHLDGFSDGSCPVTIHTYVSTNGANNWEDSTTSTYTNLITGVSSGVITIKPLKAVFDTAAVTSF
jgi:hypothetical protein